MKTDIELMLLAAKVMHHKQVVSFMNFSASASGDSVCLELGNGPGAITSYWKPMHDDGDALRLAVELRMLILQYPGDSAVRVVDSNLDSGVPDAIVSYGVPEDARAATRRAIVRLAASIGESL